jgi:hypothetical protein
VIQGMPLNRGGGDEPPEEPTGGGIASIPKTGKSPRPNRGDDGLEPEPAT